MAPFFAWGRIVFGNKAGNAIDAGAGDQTVFGLAGDDTLGGEAGDDCLFGGRGSDILEGGEGKDWLSGGKGDDTLDGGAGSDVVRGGKGDDLAIHTAFGDPGSHDLYDGGRGTDKLLIRLSEEQLADQAVQAELAAFRQLLAEGRDNHPFTFWTLGLTARDFEKVEVVVPNRAPFAFDQDVTLAGDGESAPVAFDAGDPDGDPLTFEIIESPANGTLLVNGGQGTFVYDPDDDFIGTDSFLYQVEDPGGLVAMATVSITVDPVDGDLFA